MAMFRCLITRFLKSPKFIDGRLQIQCTTINSTNSTNSYNRISSANIHLMVKNFSKNEPNIEAPVDLNTPIKYTSSRAHEHDPYETFLSRNKDRPWYQPYVVIASTSAFLLYFLFLREENDLDQELKKSLYEIIPGLEEEDLKTKLDNAKNMGIENKNMEKRLKEIRTAKT